MIFNILGLSTLTLFYEIGMDKIQGQAEKEIDMFPPYRPGELFFPLTRAEGNSTIPFFYETLLTLLLFSTSTYSFGMLIHFSHISPLFFTVGPRG